MDEGVKKYNYKELGKFSQAVFQYYGVDKKDSNIWSDVLVWANLRGVDSHGILRIPTYVEYLKTDIINASPNIDVNLLNGATARLDADLAPGPVALDLAMQTSIEKANEFNVGWCAVSHLTHAGAVGYFSLKAARVDMIGIVMTASQPMMAYPGSSKNAVSTNPLAIAVPRAARSPLMLDMSTSTVGMGKVLQARDQGLNIPNAWGLDETGTPTTDPNQLAVLSPLGGAKGAGLSLMIECMTSLIVNNPLIEPVLRTGYPLEGRPINGVTIAVNPSIFGNKDHFLEQVEALAEQIINLPKLSGVDEIYAPGERGDTILKVREQEGIPLPDGTVKRLKPIAEECDLKFPEPL